MISATLDVMGNGTRTPSLATAISKVPMVTNLAGHSVRAE